MYWFGDSEKFDCKDESATVPGIELFNFHFRGKCEYLTLPQNIAHGFSPQFPLKSVGAEVKTL